ncbi:MAG: aconitate hydratase AcnA [Methermicoccaceae archaeon]
MSEGTDPFGAKDTIETSVGRVSIYRLKSLEEAGIGDISHLPYSIRVLLESLLRQVDGRLITSEDVRALAKWSPESTPKRNIPFIPTRVLLQDFTGVPAVVDLAAMRSAMHRLGQEPSRINPLIPADLVIDHSLQVDYHGTAYAREYNERKEFERNGERYAFLRWAQRAFRNFRVVPPSKGIIHQVNLEYLASVVQLKRVNGELTAYPDTLVGTDSHTTMINSLGVLGWGVGGIEAEAIMLGQPYYMPIPEVVGFKLYGRLREGVSATDLVLTITQMLREHGVVGKFVEFYGSGVRSLSLPDRATIANMAPEYGATVGFFPVDDETLRYLLDTGRKREHVELVGRYAREQGLFVSETTPEPIFTSTLELNMAEVEPCLAGPKRPQDRIPLRSMKETFAKGMGAGRSKGHRVYVDVHGTKVPLTHGSVVIAAIASCTNTSNPSVMMAAGLVAKRAVELGLSVPPHVKTSLTPGSRTVAHYLEKSNLMPYLEALGFHIAGYGCASCIGNSGSLPEGIVNAINENDLVAAAVLSGNRNFEGRINPHVKANYLASPPLVVAYAIAGTVDIDMTSEPLGFDANDMPVYLKDVWPSHEEVRSAMKNAIEPEMFKKSYADIFRGTRLWEGLDVPEGDLYKWNTASTYIREPPFFEDFRVQPPEKGDIVGARVLALLGDSITTDHISPAGAISPTSPAGTYLISQGVDQREFNSFGARRGNHEVMVRGTFGNIRLKNRLAGGREGGWTVYHPTGELMTIYDAAMRYRESNVPLIVIAGKEYGTGSSRDWAAKGTQLLGVRAVVAESFERIHRSNLVGVGVLPLQFKKGENADVLGLKGDESYDVLGVANIEPAQKVRVVARDKEGNEKMFTVISRLDTPAEVEYYRNGGILQTVLRGMIKGE